MLRFHVILFFYIYSGLGETLHVYLKAVKFSNKKIKAFEGQLEYRLIVFDSIVFYIVFTIKDIKLIKKREDNFIKKKTRKADNYNFGEENISQLKFYTCCWEGLL